MSEQFVASQLRQQISRRLRYFVLSAASWRRQSPIWLAAVLIGCSAYVFGTGSRWSHTLFEAAYANSPYWALLITPCGLGLSVFLLNRYFAGLLGGGIPQAIASLHPGTLVLRERVLTLKAAFGQVLLTLIGISSGATFGYEGPIVQVGAAIKYSLNRSAAIKNEGTSRSLILAGAAASVAAAFNAPLAGIVFAIEEMGHAFDQRATSTILLSVIIAGLTALSLQGNYNYFGITSVTLDLRQGWIALPVCGIAGGLIGGFTAKIMLKLAASLPTPLQRLRQKNPVLFAAACGLLIAVIGILAGGITFGTGYWRAREIILQGGDGLEGYGALKWLTFLISFVSGAPGGTLAPALAVGAGIGLNLASLMPDLPQTAVILLCMVAFFSGMTRAPMTGFVIVMEISDSSSMIIPLMASALIAANLSRLISRKAFYGEMGYMLLRKFRREMAEIDRPQSAT
ncbi:MAG: chloride channel protein [Paludibacterium sp.]|uniref:chloride channel protein n=1 Tax=Paludibacterium sp. TaxID=1917523 RepID=UPI0025F46B01|nr:chloride channel protein [Paludibacterium sp.]MBV8047338.1 chloride channel protein [Paludibacterium sp.]MBV8646652.1 chloride channel protein [Paludibacterium sp.]